MKGNIINKNTLIFKVSSDGQFSSDLLKPLSSSDNNVVNFIADMSDVHLDTIEIIKNNLVIFGRSIYENNGSFVIVCSHVFSEKLNIVPTIQEALDFIEMEDIERQLNY